MSEIRARLDVATPGPWFRDPAEPFVTNGKGFPEKRIMATALRGRNDDAEFIAHAPADIAWLLDEVERLRGEG